jgi:hypothetical protein
VADADAVVTRISGVHVAFCQV